MPELNVLVLSAGRRVELVQAFRSAASRLGVQSRVVAADCQPLAPALYFADERVMLPRVSEPGYVDVLIREARRNDVALIVPTIDTELPILAENRIRIEDGTGARVMISDEAVVRLCGDKIATHRFLVERGFGAPRLYSPEDLDCGEYSLPLFIKPQAGSASIGAHRVDTAEELQGYRRTVQNPMVQELVEGEEYTIDCFADLTGEVISVVPRVRLATRGGEVAKGRIVRHDALIADARRLLEALRPIGHVTVQCIVTNDGRITYIEVNPRFGGGAPMSIASGADSCERLYRILLGEELQYDDGFRDGLTFLRYDQSVCLDETLHPIQPRGVW